MTRLAIASMAGESTMDASERSLTSTSLTALVWRTRSSASSQIARRALGFSPWVFSTMIIGGRALAVCCIANTRTIASNSPVELQSIS